MQSIAAAGAFKPAPVGGGAWDDDLKRREGPVAREKWAASRTQAMSPPFYLVFANMTRFSNTPRKAASDSTSPGRRRCLPLAMRPSLHLSK